MKRSAPPLFRLRTQRIVSGESGAARKLDKLARDLSLESDFAGIRKWAKQTLRKAGLPTDLKPKMNKNGSSTIPLLDRAIVTPGTIPSRAANVIHYTTAAVKHVESGNSRDAVYCATRAIEDFWKGWIDENLAPWIHTGASVLQSAARRGEEIRRKAGTHKTIQRYSELLAERPGESGLSYCRTIAAEQSLSLAAVRKRVQRHIDAMKA